MRRIVIVAVLAALVTGTTLGALRATDDSSAAAPLTWTPKAGRAFAEPLQLHARDGVLKSS